MSNFKVKPQTPMDSNIKYLKDKAYKVGGIFSKSVVYRPNKYEINYQTVTSYTLDLSDNEKLLIFDNADPITITVPNNSSAPFELGTRIDVVREGDGSVTFVEDTSVTIKSKDSNKAIISQYVAISLIKVEENTWYLVGDLG
jgi:hypothetical protein